MRTKNSDLEGLIINPAFMTVCILEGPEKDTAKDNRGSTDGHTDGSYEMIVETPH